MLITYDAKLRYWQNTTSETHLRLGVGVVDREWFLEGDKIIRAQKRFYIDFFGRWTPKTPQYPFKSNS